MAVGIALLLDLAARAPRGSLHSHATLSAAAAASAAAALAAAGVPLSARHLFGLVPPSSTPYSPTTTAFVVALASLLVGFFVCVAIKVFDALLCINCYSS
jgi:hypothetical protein